MHTLQAAVIVERLLAKNSVYLRHSEAADNSSMRKRALRIRAELSGKKTGTQYFDNKLNFSFLQVGLAHMHTLVAAKTVGRILAKKQCFLAAQ